MDELTKTIASRGDLAHLALFLWASGASAVLVWLPRSTSYSTRTEMRKSAEAKEVFRQFAWHLAGTLASTRGKGKR